MDNPAMLLIGTKCDEAQLRQVEFEEVQVCVIVLCNGHQRFMLNFVCSNLQVSKSYSTMK